MPKKKAPARAQLHSKKRPKKKTPAPAPARAKTKAMKEGYVTGVEFATRVGLSKNAASYMAREEGAPFDTNGWRWPEALHWFIRREKARGRPVDTNESGVEIRNRRDSAMADLAELDLAARRGQTMTLEQYDDAVSSAFARVRARALNLPGKIAGAGELKSREDLLVITEGFVDEMLEELARADDVPMTAEATETAEIAA